MSVDERHIEGEKTKKKHHAHLFAQCSNIPRCLDNSLSPIMMLIELTAKVFKDRLKRRCSIVCRSGGHAGGNVGCSWSARIRAVIDNVSFPRPFRAGHGVVNMLEEREKKVMLQGIEKTIGALRCGTGNRECGESSDLGIARFPWSV